MPSLPTFFNYIFILQFGFLFFWFIMTIVVIVAIWRTMKAHESIARSLRIMTQEMKTNVANEGLGTRPSVR